jgi:hypothetical protein
MEWTVLERGLDALFLEFGLAVPSVLTRMIGRCLWHVIRAGMTVGYSMPTNDDVLHLHSGACVARVVRETALTLVLAPVNIIYHHKVCPLTIIDLTVFSQRESLWFPGEILERHSPLHSLIANSTVDVFEPTGMGHVRTANLQAWKGSWNCGYVLMAGNDSLVIHWFDTGKQVVRTEELPRTSARLAPWGTHTFYAT